MARHRGARTHATTEQPMDTEPIGTMSKVDVDDDGIWQNTVTCSMKHLWHTHVKIYFNAVKSFSLSLFVLLSISTYYDMFFKADISSYNVQWIYFVSAQWVQMVLLVSYWFLTFLLTMWSVYDIFLDPLGKFLQLSVSFHHSDPLCMIGQVVYLPVLLGITSMLF